MHQSAQGKKDNSKQTLAVFYAANYPHPNLPAAPVHGFIRANVHHAYWGHLQGRLLSSIIHIQTSQQPLPLLPHLHPCFKIWYSVIDLLPLDDRTDDRPGDVENLLPAAGL